jgi:branched-chain amino acid transport system substrate-binding protein
MRHSLGKHLGRLGVAALVIAPVSGVMSVVGGSAAGASGAPITIAMVASLTGPGASEFSQSPAGFKARIEMQNAQGGVNGHKLVGLVLDDQTSPTGVSTAIQDTLSKGAFGLVSTSPLFFLAAKVPNQQGVPVTGGFFDGPEWGQQPYTNMFAADVGSVDPTYPVNTAIGSFMKTHGGTVVCSYGYSISPSSSRSAIGTADSFPHAGARRGAKGLQLAGKNPTHAGVIKALRNLKSYNGNGLLPVSINFSTIFGHDSAKACGWYMIAEKNGFAPSSSQPSCGTDIPGTSTASS